MIYNYLVQTEKMRIIYLSVTSELRALGPTTLFTYNLASLFQDFFIYYSKDVFQMIC